MLSVVITLGLVTAEALWTMRPWAYRASQALAASVVGLIVLAGLHVMPSDPWTAMWMFVIAAISRWGIRPVVEYVRNQGRVPLRAP